MNSFPLSQKYKDFINTTDVVAEFLEGTTASGKTTVGAGVKFMRMVSASDMKLHVISAKTAGKAEETIIQQDNGICDLHSNAKYFGNGDKDYKLPHIKFEDKVIYVLGYSSKDKWEMVLGAQFGCVYIDEINTADIEFIREISTRNKYLLATLNPDNPALPVYKEFVNRSRPFKKYVNDIPKEILAELTEEPVSDWRYWFFSFKDNLSLSNEAIERKISSAPKGTKYYKNKILGLRGKATGLVFSNFEKHHIKTKAWAKSFCNDLIDTEKFIQFSIGVDTAYSQQSPDTISLVFIGITNKGKCIQLDEREYNNAQLDVPLAPSDTVQRIIEFAERNRQDWGFARDIYIDSADQATITELKKYKRNNGSVYNFVPSYKKTKIIDRINLQLGWFAKQKYFVLDHCKCTINEYGIYSWLEDKDNTPEDSNDHFINASQYSWLPYKHMIGDINGAD